MIYMQYKKKCIKGYVMYIKIHIGTHVFGHVLQKQSNHHEKTLKLSKPNAKPKTK